MWHANKKMATLRSLVHYNLELCLGRVKPEETLVEARISADVQIACIT